MNFMLSILKEFKPIIKFKKVRTSQLSEVKWTLILDVDFRQMDSVYQKDCPPTVSLSVANCDENRK